MKTALVAGATGLIGEQLVQQLLQSSQYGKVIVLVRRNMPPHATLDQLTIDLGKGESYEGIVADDVFCCLGTTIKTAGSQEKFRAVDFHYPLQLAKSMKANGAKQYLLVSALGANKSSSIFYNRVKGEVEDAIAQVGFDALHIFRPSLLIGNRKEKRSGEDAAKWFYSVFGFLIPTKYKGIDVRKIARAMITFAVAGEKGIFIHESDQLQKF